MLFNTIDFAIFLPIVVLIYYLIPQKQRWILLLAASYYFYMSWKVEYILLIIASTTVDYFSGIRMARLPDRKSRLPWLILSLCVNLGLLFSFKYFNFATENLNLLFQKVGLAREIPVMKVLLPVGISFYTFQTLSYSIDVYFGRQKAERHLGYFALYVSFFPQLVAGPIERYSRLAPQFRMKQTISNENMVNGLRLILYGLFIKMVIADNISGIVDQVYAHPGNFSSGNILKGIFLYSFQIYSDFYGYSTIAIGSALLLGIRIMDNFKSPYLAKNISEFWQRWHISLSTWFRDYLYFPLGGNRVSRQRWVLNILVVFLISGLWHGANWTFIIWGLLFGLLYMAERFLNGALNLKLKYAPYSAGHILLALKTFLLVTVLWVFFRSQSFNGALSIFKLLFQNAPTDPQSLLIPISTWIFLLLFIISDVLLYNRRFDSWISGMHYLLRWGIYAVLLFGIIAFAGVENFPFIYFQF
ncbi:MAG: MBOAT family O-acyltransferase [Bacteroidota bacterium]|nr:MBOAT family O-acyltransferase [Bacteroidota bacterium]